MYVYTACENAVSGAVTEAKQVDMRLKSAQAELKEKERASKSRHPELEIMPLRTEMDPQSRKSLMKDLDYM